MHEEEGASRFDHVHCCVHILHPGREAKVSEWARLSFDERAPHRPEHGLCGRQIIVDV